MATTAIREVIGHTADISVALNVHTTLPDDASSLVDRFAAQKIDLIANQIFLGPMLDGDYPAELISNTSHISDWSFVEPGDLALICQPLSCLGVNYYFSNRVRFFEGGRSRSQADGHNSIEASPWVGCDDVEFVQTPGPHTAMGWNIDPASLTELLLKLSYQYPELPLLITENGAAFDDTLGSDLAIHDERRIDFLSRHIHATKEAIAQGASVRGFMAWSLLDNFEWVYGYSRRFGLIYVDYSTGERIWKDSAHWYKAFIAKHGAPSVVQ